VPKLKEEFDLAKGCLQECTFRLTQGTLGTLGTLDTLGTLGTFKL
jgi:hypothetical protein